MILTLLQTGMRASELAAIKARDIDSEQGTVTIRAGKGGKSRILAASPELLEALGLLIGEKLGYQDVYRCVRQVGQRARVEDVHPHRFRHTFAHSFLAAGGDIGDLRVLLGHSSFAMTARYSSYFEGQRAVASHRRFLAG
jgi:integrase/recombinase XerC/integrase/recombinase XerD